MAILVDLVSAINTFKLAEPGIVQIMTDPPIDMRREWAHPKTWTPYQAPGIYAIIDENSNILYVGQSNHPPGRLNAYFGAEGPSDTSSKDWLGHMPTSVLLARVNDLREAKFLERYLIFKLNPPFNKD
jgi:hypothetical protein